MIIVRVDKSNFWTLINIQFGYDAPFTREYTTMWILTCRRAVNKVNQLHLQYVEQQENGQHK